MGFTNRWWTAASSPLREQQILENHFRSGPVDGQPNEQLELRFMEHQGYWEMRADGRHGSSVRRST